MKSIVHEDIFAHIPNYVRAIVVARNINNRGNKKNTENLLREYEEQTKRLFSVNSLTQHPHIKAWRDAYKVFNMKGGKYYSSVEALARRVRNGTPLPYINTLVAIMNAFSLRYLVPCGGDDIGKSQGNVMLRTATGNEYFTPFNSTEVQQPLSGEVIYVDNKNNILCRRWNWRQGRHTKITEDTQDALVNLDCLYPVTVEMATGLVEELASVIEKYCDAEVSFHIIQKNKQEANLW